MWRSAPVWWREASPQLISFGEESPVWWEAAERGESWVSFSRSEPSCQAGKPWLWGSWRKACI